MKQYWIDFNEKGEPDFVSEYNVDGMNEDAMKFVEAKAVVEELEALKQKIKEVYDSWHMGESDKIAGKAIERIDKFLAEIK